MACHTLNIPSVEMGSTGIAFPACGLASQPHLSAQKTADLVSAPYIFTSEEIAFARRLALARSEAKKNAASHKTLKGRDHLHDEVVGALGEILIGKILGKPVDISIHDGGDNGVDFEFQGVTLDIKSTEYPWGKLIYDRPEKLRADAAVLVLVEYRDTDRNDRPLPPEKHRAAAKCMGWVWRDQFTQGHYIKWMGHGDRAVMDQRQLNGMRAFPLDNRN